MNISKKRLLEFDEFLCLKINNLSGKRIIDKLSYIISKLGNGYIYFCFLAIFIFILHKPAYIILRDYLLSASINGVFHKIIKGKIKRIRPFNAIESINKIMPPPDEFSFPSGHSGAAAVFFLLHFIPYVYIFFCICVHMDDFSWIFSNI